MNRWLAALLAFAVAIVGSTTSYAARERRRQDRAIHEGKWDEYLEKHVASGQFTDIGVRLVAVVQDANGAELLPGKPLLRIVRERTLGGIVDRKLGAIVSPTRAPVTWYCSEDQWDIILHADALPLGLLVYGSEGAGKTTALAMWHYCRWLENIGDRREGGQTAPTKERLEALLAEVQQLWPTSWYKHLKSRNILRLCDGNAQTATKIRFRATKQQSKTSGSPIQGWNWSWAGRDEIQDQIDRHEDIEARGRSARGGRYKQLGTATAKDSSVWRAFRDLLTTAKDGMPPDWLRLTLLGQRSPFVEASFWETKKRTLSKRAYQRRVLAMDVPPELAVYYSWDRDRNLLVVPQIGGTDVTPAVLADYTSLVRPGARFALLAGHDPGSIYNTTTFYRLLMLPMARTKTWPLEKPLPIVPTWVCVGEIVTSQTTARDHARQVRLFVQERWGFERGTDTSKVAIFCDPHGKGNGQTDFQAVYMAFQKEGLDVFSPAPNEGRIHRAARIELVNRLCAAYDGSVRFAVACDEHKQPCAPVLVESFESLEKRAGDDDPEGSQRKDEKDRTHAPASASYALWMFEQEAFTEITVARAHAAARRAQL